MGHPDFLLQEAIHIQARLDALRQYRGYPERLAQAIARRERELWDEIRQREHATDRVKQDGVGSLGAG